MAQTYEVVVTPQAEESLNAIVGYLLETASDSVAERVRAGIIEEIRGTCTSMDSILPAILALAEWRLESCHENLSG